MNINIPKNKAIFILLPVLLVFFLSINISCNNRAQDSITKQSKKYYIDPVTGNDSANGTTENTAWKSFKNIENRIFHPGEHIFLAEGTVFSDALILKDIHGTKESPVLISTFNPKGTSSEQKTCY